MYQRCAVVCPAAVSTKDVMKGVWKSSTRTDGELSATGRSETSKLASSATVSASPGWLPASCSQGKQSSRFIRVHVPLKQPS